MTLTHGFTNELKMLTENDTLGAVAGELLNVTLDRIGSSVNTPMYLSASFPTADSLLNIGPSLVASGDGAGKSVAPIGSTIPTTVLTTIDFQTGTVTGQTVTVDGGTFTLPTGTVSQYRRCVFVLRDDGSIDSSFSAESATISGLDNAGSLIAGLAITSLIPIGWVDLECDNSSGKYRTAGSSSSIIENKVGLDFRIVRSALLEDTGGAGFRVVRLHGGLILGSGGGDVSAEATARMNADSTLQAHIDAEQTARTSADSSLSAAIATAGSSDFALGSISGGAVTIKSGFIRLGDRGELQVASDLSVPLDGVKEITQIGFSYNGRVYDRWGAGAYIQLYGGGGVAHYFWFKTSGGMYTQTEPVLAVAGTGHEVDIVAGMPTGGTIQVVDWTTIAGATLTFSITPPIGSTTPPTVTLTEGVEWTASTDNTTTAVSIASAINSNFFLNGNNDGINPYVWPYPTTPTTGTVMVYGDMYGMRYDWTSLYSSSPVDLFVTGPTAPSPSADSSSAIATKLATAISSVSSAFIATVMGPIVQVNNVVVGAVGATFGSLGENIVVKATGMEYGDGNWYAYVRLSELLSPSTLVNGRRVYPVTASDIYFDTVSPEFPSTSDPSLASPYVWGPSEYRLPFGSIQRISGTWSNPQSLATKEWAERVSYSRLHPLARTGTNSGPELINPTHRLSINGGDSYSAMIAGREKGAWKLQASRSLLLTSLTIWLSSGSSTPSVVVSLCADDAGGMQPGTPLATDSTSYTQPVDDKAYPYNFLGITASIVEGTYYWIVVDNPTVTSPNINVSLIDLPPVGSACWSGTNVNWTYYDGGSFSNVFPTYGGTIYLEYGTAPGFDLYNNVFKIVVTNYNGQISSSLLPIDDNTIVNNEGVLSVGELNGNSLVLINQQWLKGKSTTNTLLNILQINASNHIEFDTLPYGPSGTDPSANNQFATKHYVDTHTAGGTVTSVGLNTSSFPEVTVGSSPVTTSGTITLTKANQSPNLVWAGPTTGSPAAPSFRALVTGDIPTTLSNMVMSGQFALDSEVAAVSGGVLTPTADKPIQRITSSGASLDTITGGTAGEYKILINETASSISVTNNTGAGSNSIYTGTGSNVTFASNSALTLVYDSGLSRWLVVGGAADSTLQTNITNETSARTAADSSLQSQINTKGSGTVTSVGLSTASFAEVTVGSSPVTGSGTITLSKAVQSANWVWAGPTTGSAAAPSFRALVAGDIPSLDAGKIGTGTLSIARGGTNSGTTLNNNRVMISSGSAVVEAPAITASRVIVSDTSGLPTASSVSTTTLGYLDATSSIQTQFTARTSADNTEITARSNADTTLQNNINSEITTRANADATLQSAINAIAPGLVITPVTAAAISGTTLSNNRHYIIDMNAASGNISVNLPAVSSGLVMWLTVVRNKTNNYRVTVVPNGADLIYYSGTSYTAMTMYFLESWAQMMSDGTRWYVDDPSDGGTIGTAPLGIISNIIASPSTADPDWGSSNATVTTTTTSGQLPLEGIINSAIAITSPTLGGYGRIRWTVPTALKARRFIVEWQQIASSLLSGDFRVEIYTNTASDYSGTSTKLPLTTDVSNTSGIPNINGRYHTWFTTDASLSYYEMRVVRTAGSSATIYLTNVLASPTLEEEEPGIVFVNAAGTTAKVGDTIGADSTSGAFTITAPANPIPGNRFRVIDVGGVATTNNITIGRNGSNIASLAVDMDIDINWLDVTLTYYNATVGWAPSR